MAYSFANKNGTSYITMDGQEYPLFNRWDNAGGNYETGKVIMQLEEDGVRS